MRNEEKGVTLKKKLGKPNRKYITNSLLKSALSPAGNFVTFRPYFDLCPDLFFLIASSTWAHNPSREYFLFDSPELKIRFIKNIIRRYENSNLSNKYISYVDNLN